MKKISKLPKKLLSLLIAVLMVVSSMPFAAFARDTGLDEAAPYWTRIASSNFDSTTGVDTSKSNKLYNLNQSPVIKSGDKPMTWGVCDYKGASSSDGSGLYIDDGYLVLTGYNGSGTTPVTSKANFKIDVELEWTAENANANSQRYCTLQLAEGTALGKTNATMGSSASNIIAQDYYGKVYVGTNSYGNEGTSYCISPYSANLTTGKKYHYIMTYVNKTLKTYVTDANYTVMQDVCTVENVDIDTSKINSICLGDDDTSYYFHNTKYHSITFYEGKTTSVKPVDTANSKYLFAYFTGNNSNDESLHLAVSTDGMQWKTLNKNYPVWNGTAATEIIPNNNGSVAASTHIRDPYIMRAQDGSYYVLATDLNTVNGTSWGNNSKMHIFKVDSLADFNNNEKVQHWDIDMQSVMQPILGGNTIRTWAPQAIYDPEYGQYMLYWSAATDAYTKTSMYYVYTTDFKNFTTTPKRLISPIGAGDNGDLNEANIDGDIYYNGQFYYLWYKNEATSSLAVMTSESPSGPYTNLKTFSYSQALEGPQVYQLQNNQYVLLADAYNNYHYRAFVSDTVDGFTADKEDNNTNIDSLQPRHGAVIQIDDAEYNALVNKFGIDNYDNDKIIRYEFSLDHHNESDGYTGKTWEGNQYNYDIGYKNDSNSYAQMGDGKAKLVGKNLFINDTNVREVIRNATFTFSFKFKLTQKVAKNPVIFATCSSASANTDYVRLLQDGTFTVNGKDCTEKANIVAGEEHTYTIAYSGVDETAILLQDEKLVGAIPTGVMNNTGAQFVGLGFSDVMKNEGRIYGEYSALTFQKTIPDDVKAILNANIKDTYMDTINKAKGTLDKSTVEAKKAETFNATGYYGSKVATDAYSNMLYCSQTRSEGSETNRGYIIWKFVFPKVAVLAYDGTNAVYSPAVVLTKSNGSTKRQVRYVSVNDGQNVELRRWWVGYQDYKEQYNFPATATNDDFSNVSTDSATSDKFNNSGTFRAWSNQLGYTGGEDTTNYYKTVSNANFTVCSDYFGQTETLAGNFTNYYINYKPVKELLDGTTTHSINNSRYTFKQLFAYINDNEANKIYTAESVAAYYKAVNQIMNLDVNGAFSDATDTNVAGKVTDVAGKIETAVTDYNAAVKGLTRQYKVTFKKASVEGGAIISIKYVSVKDDRSVEAIKAIAPANSPAWYDTSKHYTYNWDSITNVNGDVVFYEKRDDTKHSYTATTEADNPSESETEKPQRFKASTCTEAGFYYNVCSCGYEYLVNTNALGHNYQSTVGSPDITLYKAATCTEDGFHKMICQRCNDTYIVIDGALDHDWGTPVPNGKGSHTQTCTRDSNHTQELPCNMVVQNETETQTVMVCDTCGYSVTTVKLNRTAYNEALANAIAVLENEKAKYSADSLSALQAVLVEAGKDALAATTQEELNDVTARITAANSTDTENGGVLVPNTFRITYGNMFSFDDFMNSDSKDCATDNGKEKGTIGFDFDNQVFTVTSNDKYSDVYSAFGGAGTYKIPVSDSTSYTFEFTAKGAETNQVHVFFYNENGPINVGENYTYLYNGAEQTTKSTDYFVCKYNTLNGGTTKLTFTPPAGTVRVDVRFGVTTTSTSCSFYNIGFYETAMVENLVLADGVVYGTSFDEVAIRQPEIDGMHFGGWFVDKALTTSASTLTEITRNVNIYAKLDALKVKDVVGCTLVKHGYTTYVCSDENCSTDVVYTSYDDKILDGSAFFPANNAIQAIIDAEIANGYLNYTQASIEALASARENLYNTTVNYHTQDEVDAAVTTMNNLVSNLVVKINFVTKGNNEVESTQTVEVPYNSSFTAPPVNQYTTVDGRYTWTFTSWDKEVVTSNVTTGATYVAQYTKTDNIDRTAYDAAVALAEASIANTAKYNKDSRNALQDVLDKNTIKEDTTQAVINAMTEAIVSANKLVADKGILVLEQYNIVLNIHDEDKGVITEKAVNETVDYGTPILLNLDEHLPENYKKAYAVKSWKRHYTNGNDEVIYGAKGTTLTAVVNSNVTYNVYIVSTSVTSIDGSAAVILNNKSNKAVEIDYIKTGETTVTFDKDKSTVTLKNQQDENSKVTLTAPNYSFYKVDGFFVNNKQVTNGESVSITEDTVIKPIYVPNISYFVELDDGIRTTSNEFGTVKKGWDQRVVVTADGATKNTAWYYQYKISDGVYSEPKLSAYGETYSFQVSQSCKITCDINNEQALPTSTIEYVSYNIYKPDTISTVSRYSLPTGYEFVSAGVILKSARQLGESSAAITHDKIDALNNKDNYKTSNTSGVYRANEFVNSTKQYLINVHLSKSYYAIEVGAVAFLEYKEPNSDEIKTVYSDIARCSYSQTTQN